MKKIYFLPAVIVLLLIVIVVEAGIILYRKGNASGTVGSKLSTASPIPKPEQKGRQAVYIAETAGLESASASLVYRGTVLGLSKNDSSQIAELTVKVVGVKEEVSFYFDQATIDKTVILTSEDEKQPATYEKMQELITAGTVIRIIFDYNILSNSASSISLELL
ncbi:hypothetical protein IPM65_02425 [Candidatus Roizmanbacteria bacterium]|nr:MAG: hypothetical protein IPM65_02425 [Candidatus Roizmanbacteria bacterium]